MFSCRKAARLVSDGTDRDLSARERASLRMHLLICSSCRRYRRQLEKVRRLILQSGASLETALDAAGGSLSAEARQRIAKTLRAELDRPTP